MSPALPLSKKTVSHVHSDLNKGCQNRTNLRISMPLYNKIYNKIAFFFPTALTWTKASGTGLAKREKTFN